MVSMGGNDTGGLVSDITEVDFLFSYTLHNDGYTYPDYLVWVGGHSGPFDQGVSRIDELRQTKPLEKYTGPPQSRLNNIKVKPSPSVIGIKCFCFCGIGDMLQHGGVFSPPLLLRQSGWGLWRDNSDPVGRMHSVQGRVVGLGYLGWRFRFLVPSNKS